MTIEFKPLNNYVLIDYGEAKKAEEKHQEKKDELIREIGNREEEIRLLNKLNQQMKEETRTLDTTVKLKNSLAETKT